MTKYFAKLGLSSKVVGREAVRDDIAATELKGIQYLTKREIYPFWVQTFKDRSKRKNFACKGMTYDEDRDAFIPPQPTINHVLFKSWVLNEDTCQWEAPVAYPADGSIDKRYNWNEETTSWEEVT